MAGSIQYYAVHGSRRDNRLWVSPNCTFRPSCSRESISGKIMTLFV